MSSKKAIGLSPALYPKIVESKLDHQKKISYTQFSTYAQCEYRWNLHYAQGLYPFASSINTVFGTAMHETLQEWIDIIFNKSIKASEEFPMFSIFQEKLVDEYEKEVIKNEGIHFSTKEELLEFMNDGVEILDWIKKKRVVYFDPKNYELLGCEVPLMTQIDDKNDVFVFEGFIDLILKDKTTGNIYVDDIKTSTRGWNDKQKKDDLKISQGLLYKKYFSKQFGVSEDRIIPRFIVLKRKIWEEAQFPQPRLSVFEPANGKAKVTQAVSKMKYFIDGAFNPDGSPQKRHFPKNPSPSNCKYCPFNNDLSLCDQRKG